MQNLVSIIIPIYNAEEHIESMLRSVAEQSFTDFEVIMIDDGSTDSSAETAKKFQDQHPHFYYYFQNNAGVSAARNKGIEMAKGKYLCFIDADDAVSPQYLQDFIDHYENAQTLLIQDITRIGSVEEVPHFFNFKSEKIATTDWQTLLSRPEYLIGYPFNKFFEADIIKAHHLIFDTKVSMGEDKIFFTEYLNHIKYLKFLPCSNYRYYFHEGSAVTKKHNYQSHALFLANEAEFLKKLVGNDLGALQKTYAYIKHSHFTVESIRAIYRADEPQDVRFSQLLEIYNLRIFNKIHTVGKKNFLHFYLFNPSMFWLFDRIAQLRFKTNAHH